MQKILLISLAIIFLQGAHAQKNYCSYFGERYTKWHVHYEIADFEKDGVINIGDSPVKINDKWYKKIALDRNYFFYMREDRDKGQLFLLDNNMENEYLISDMSLEEGDVFRFPDWVYFKYYEGMQKDKKGYFSLVDSIYYEDGRKHVRLELMYDRNDGFLEFIEGVGPNSGFYHYIEPFYHKYRLHLHETETRLWKN